MNVFIKLFFQKLVSISLILRICSNKGRELLKFRMAGTLNNFVAKEFDVESAGVNV